MSQPPAVSKAAAPYPSKAGASGNTGSQASSPATGQAQQFFSGPRAASGGASAACRPQASPRNSQSNKPKHRSRQKFQALDVDEDERIAMQNIGRRGKTADITHLMNISLPPRPQQGAHHRHSYNGPRGGRAAGRYGGGGGWGLGRGYHAVDKARYIHANYRFIVDPRGDYQSQASDADVHLDWTHVLQIIASSKTQAASCPICLGEPTAPRMAKCGHIFCLPCLIRYMHSDDDAATHQPEKKARCKKCPICWDSIYISETRPARFYAGQEIEPPREGSDVVLRLVKRKTGSTLAMPRESANTLAKGEAVPWYFAAEVMDYARVMKGSEEYMVGQYDEAIRAIEQVEKEDELMFGEDAEWTGRAIRMLNEAKEKARGIGNPPAQPKKPEQQAARGEQKPVEDRASMAFHGNDAAVSESEWPKQAPATPSSHAASIEMDAVDDTPTPRASHPASDIPRTIHEMRHRQDEKPQPAEYLFYEALQHYYLSPLDIRILKSAFGSYSAFPSSILPRVERVSSGHIVDDELRKRVKYLSHLPYGCEVGFLECDWTDTVPPQILNEFRPMLEKRRKRHDEKEAREEKERIRIEKAEERELASIRRKRPSAPDDPAFTTGWEALPSTTPESSTLAGATVGNDTAAASPPWPNRTTSGFASLASPSTSPTVQRTVWGTAAVAPASPDLHSQLPSDAQFSQHDDGWLQGWERDLLDDGDLAANLEGVSLEGTGHGGGGGAGGKKGGKGGKGKKGKKITLMSTTPRRGA